LREFLILGVKTSIPLHRWLMAHPDVRSGNVDTSWLERTWSVGESGPVPETDLDAAAVAAALLSDAARNHAISSSSSADVKDGHVSAWRLAARRAALS
jgi:acetyl/propionyl-CoA carboxylase alpha subunit